MLGALGARKIFAIAAVVIAAPIVYYLASPLVNNIRVDESSGELGPDGPGVVGRGSFVDADAFHRTSGAALVLQLGNGSRILRFEGFQTVNGPDLFVYLSTDVQAQDFVNLGRLKGNLGDQNYPVPEDVDVDRYRYALIWCRAFTTLFGSATLVRA